MADQVDWAEGRAAQPPLKVVDGHFEVMDVLGTGGMGSVYRVRDVRDGRQVALKTLAEAKDDHSRRQLRDMFRREYRTLQQLAHPVVIEVYDYGVAEDVAYYTMELLDGTDLHALAPAPFRDVCRYARDVCSALSLLHSRRLLHRDVSPRNIRCVGERAKLIDFGAMASMGVALQIVGTPPFVPPEALDTQLLDGRSDLYSLGATLYYALTGRHAYPARTLSSLPSFWQRPPTPPSVLVPGIPKELDALVMGLMARRVDARPGSAAEVIDRLTSLADLGPADDLEVRRAYLTTPELVGREQAVDAIRAQLRRAGSGQAGALAFRGASGLGRSRMLDVVSVEARMEGLEVIRVQPSNLPEGAYALVPLLLEQLGELVMRKERARAPAGQLPLEVTPSSQLQARDRKGMLERIRTLARRATRVRPLVLAVDDVEQLDRASQTLLATLYKASHHRLLPVFTVADSEVVESSLSDLMIEGQVIGLAPLSEASTEALLRSLFGDVPGVPALGARLQTLAQGNHRATMELVQHLVEEGALRYELGRWVVPARLDDALPTAWKVAVDARVERLPPAALQLATRLAFAVEYSRDPALLGLLLDDEMAGGEAALDTLVAADLFRVDGRRYGFASEGVAERLRNRIADEQRREIHAEIAGWLRETGADPIEVARCEQRAGQDGAAIDTLTGIVEAGSRWDTAPADYADLLLAAMDACTRLGRPARERFNLLCELVRVGEHLGVPNMRGHFQELFDVLSVESGLAAYEALPEDMEAGARLGQAITDAQARHDAQPEAERILSPVEGIRMLAMVVRQAAAFGAMAMDYDLQANMPSLEPFAPLSPAIAAALDGTLPACLHLTAGRYELAYEAYARTLTRLSQEDRAGLDEEYWRWACAALRVALGHIHAGLGIEACLSQAERLEEDPAWVAAAWDVRRAYYQRLGSPSDVERCRDRIERIALESNRRPPIVDTSARLDLDVAAHAGDLPGAKRAMERLRDLVEIHPGYAPYRYFGPAVIEHLRGNHEVALTHVERALSMTSAETHPTWACMADLLLGTLVALDRVDEACTRGIVLLAEAEAAGLEVMAAMIAVPLAVAEARRGDFASAVQRLDAAIAVCEARRMTGGDLGLYYEQRARVALWMGDEPAFLQAAECCAVEYGRGSSRLARYERLRNEARNAGMGTRSMRPAAMAEPAISTALSAFKYTVFEEGSAEHRFEAALTMLMAEAGASAGRLYDLTGASVVLRAELPVGGLDALPPLQAPEHSSGALAEDEDEDIVTETTFGASEATSSGCWVPIDLGYVCSDASFRCTGVAQLYFDGPPRGLAVELVEAAGRLIDSIAAEEADKRLG